MAERKELSKEARIKKEISRLRRVFKDLDKNTFQTVEPLIKTAAFMTITITDLEATINRDGCISEYKNGENQYGTKQSDETKTHIAMVKNLTAVIKQLAELVPPERKRDSRLNALRGE